MKTTKVKACDLIGHPLDWAVAKCRGERITIVGPSNKVGVWLVTGDGWYKQHTPYSPSTDGGQGHGLIESEHISLKWRGMVCQAELEHLPADDDHYRYGHQWGPTGLIAACRAYVESCNGDEIEIPDELL